MLKNPQRDWLQELALLEGKRELLAIKPLSQEKHDTEDDEEPEMDPGYP